MGLDATTYIGPYLVVNEDIADFVFSELDDFLFNPEFLKAHGVKGTVWLANEIEYGISTEENILYDESIVRHQMANIMQKFRNSEKGRLLMEHLKENHISYVLNYGFCIYYS